MRKHHYLKTETEYYQAVERGDKTFEIRINDRGYSVGDMIYLKEVVRGKSTGRELPSYEITYILGGGHYGIKRGWCVLALRAC